MIWFTLWVFLTFSCAGKYLDTKSLEESGPKPQYVGEEKPLEWAFSNTLPTKENHWAVDFDPELYVDEEGEPLQYSQSLTKV